jgi:hypothetical protein
MVTISDISFDGGGQHTPPYVVNAELPSLEDRESHINLHSFLFCTQCIIFYPAVYCQFDFARRRYAGFSFNAVTEWTSSQIKPDARLDGTYPSVFTSKIGAKFALAGFIPSSPVYFKLLSAGYASNNELATAFCELPSNLNSPITHEVKLRVRRLFSFFALYFQLSTLIYIKNHCRSFHLLTCFHFFAGYERLAS